MNELTYYLIALLFTFTGCCVLTAWLIPRLRTMKMGQKILEIGPAWHAPKEGTPTMGGLAFLVIAILAALLICPLAYRDLTFDRIYPFAITLLYCVANGAVGIIDDLTKLRHHRNDGLTPTQKLILQTTLAAAYLALLRLSGVIDDSLHIPFLGDWQLGFATYFVLMILLVGMTNCANLTDGIDGLASAVGAVIFAFYSLYSVWRDIFPSMLLSAIMLGCTVAFLFFNRHPAHIFMGDTGSLFIGAATAAIPLLLGTPLLAILCGVVYVVEGVSVILQVVYFKRKRKRLFLMAPIHHHLEKCGWSENKIVTVFAMCSFLACLLAIFFV